MREKIHKDIEYQTFKTISHELGTYTNFILQILEGNQFNKFGCLLTKIISNIGASSDTSIPIQIKKDYFEVN